MGSMNERDLITYITSPILSSIDDDNQRLDKEDNNRPLHHRVPQPQPIKRTFTPNDLLLSGELNQHSGQQQNDSISSLISPQFRNLTTDDNSVGDSGLSGFFHQSSPQGNFLSAGLPSRSNTLSPSNSRFYDKNSNLLSAGRATANNFGSQNLFPQESFIQRPMSAIDFASTSRPFGTQETTFDHFNSQDFQQRSFQPSVSSQLLPKVSTNFNSELFDFKIWLENLDSKQQLYVVDAIVNSIDPEIAKVLKRKLDSSMFPNSSADLVNQEHMDRLETADLMNQKQDYSQYQTVRNSANNGAVYSNLNDPHWQRRGQDFNNIQAQSNQRFQNTRNANTSNQQANPMGSYTNPRSTSPMNYDDINNQNILKLNALSTIQSRAKLDSGKRYSPNEERGRANQYQNPYNNNGAVNMNLNQQGQPQNISARYKPSSVPPLGRNSNNTNSVQDKSDRRSGTPLSATSNPSSLTGIQQPQPTNSEANKILNDSLLKLASINNIKAAQHHQHFQSPTSPSLSSVTSPVLGGAAVSKSPMPRDISSLELLNNIPQWLKILRLHKYTDILSSLDWKVMINLTDEELDKMGISTLGARRKLLKAFSAVKESYEKGEIN